MKHIFFQAISQLVDICFIMADNYFDGLMD